MAQPEQIPVVLQEGYIQSCSGYLERKSTVLKRWKRRWFSIEPGPQQHALTSQKGGVRKNFLLLPTANPGITVEPASANPSSSDFTTFHVNGKNGGKPLATFRATDIVQMRRFMASLGCTGQGMFSEQENTDVPVESTHGLWDVIHPSEDELVQRQQAFDQHKKLSVSESVTRSSDAPPSYADTMQQLPLGFYFPEDLHLPIEQRPELTYPGQSLAPYDPSAVLPKAHRRPWHDTFRPPHGPPTFFPISIGYGNEVGLPSGQQALWDPIAKCYFFLDHINKLTFFDDPRPPVDPPPIVSKAQQIYGDQKRAISVPPLCEDASVLIATAQRALSKPHGCVLFACGRNGQHGPHGTTGVTGSVGISGHSGFGSGGSGSSGGHGSPGGCGTDGLRGADATEASDIIANIWGNNEELHISGSSELIAKLGGSRREEVLFINCRGGDGGNGGHGGQGGTGGRGGAGGHGASGHHGHSSASGPGGSGGRGGNGGDGGAGGMGGPGGTGGDGGHAGFGGKCVIQAADPRLLVLVEADCTAGTNGKGGSGGAGGIGGEGGSGGLGGRGGMGGSGGSYTDGNGHRHQYPSGSTGPSGFSGSRGPNGMNGPAGMSGHDGNTACNGGILWVVSSPFGEVLYQAGTRYDAEVTSLHIASGIDDGIYEPNERISVSHLLMVNSGGLPLPSGAEAFIPSTPTIKFEPARYSLPDVVPSDHFEVPITYFGRIFDEPPPNKPGPFVSKAEFIPRIELLGRPFEKSFLKQALVVQYPVKLAFLRCTENLGRGEVSTLEIGVQNISRMPYGNCPGSGGKVVLQVHFDQRLLPVATGKIGLSDVPYTVTYDPSTRDSMFVQMHTIPPGETVTVQITVQMESRAELFDRCLWQTDLYLRDKLIEYNFQKIRVSPFYSPSDPVADVLMVTGQNITRREFVFWQHILENLNVTVDFWDTGRYNGLSVDLANNARHAVTWEGRYTGKLILYPHANLQHLWGIDIIRHFHGNNFREGPLTDSNSSMILFMSPGALRMAQSHQFQDKGDLAMLKHLNFVNSPLELGEQDYSGIHLLSPGTCFDSTQPFHSREKKLISRLEKQEPQHSYAVVGRQVNIQSTGLFRYKYGSVDLRKCPLLRSCKFAFIDGFSGSLTSMSHDDRSLSPVTTDIPLASNFGQAFLATLYGLPLFSKLSLLHPPPEDSRLLPLTFSLPNRATLTKSELIVICLSKEVADEVLNCSGHAHRMEKLAEEVSTKTDLYLASGQDIIRGMELIVKEVKLRMKQVSHQNVKSASQRITALCKSVTQALRQAEGTTTQNSLPLPRFSQLIDNHKYHFSHQHTARDERYNLIGQ